MILGVVSDLHLNFSGLSLPTEGLDALVIAGDTSPYHEQVADWLSRALPADLPVLLVMGNHDYEGFTVKQALVSMRVLLAEYGLDNVRLLDNEVAVLGGVRFLGTPLWTQFDAYEPYVPRHLAALRAHAGISDFRSIYSREGELLAPGDMTREHRTARRFLERELAVPYAGKTVVISHFLPSTRSVLPQFEGSPLNPYFAANAEDLVVRADLWIHGHTHGSLDYDLNGTRVICNPRGYSTRFGLPENPGWNPAFRIDLDAI